MVLSFSIDPATGVVKPPVTVFNGGKRSSLSGKRKQKKTKKTRKQRKNHHKGRKHTRKH